MKPGDGVISGKSVGTITQVSGQWVKVVWTVGMFDLVKRDRLQCRNGMCVIKKVAFK